MHRHLIAFGAALAAVAFVMPPAGASQESDWSDPVNIGAMINSVVLAPRRIGAGGGKRSRWKPGSMMAKWCSINPGTCNRKPAKLAAAH